MTKWNLFQVFTADSVFKSQSMGNSLAVQWLGLGAFTAGAQVQSLLGELRSCKPRSAAKKKRNQSM